jgi:hypothetical protein
LDVFLKNLRIFLKIIFDLLINGPWLHANEVSDRGWQETALIAAEVSLARMLALRE